MYPLAICTSSLEKCLFGSFAHFLFGLGHCVFTVELNEFLKFNQVPLVYFSFYFHYSGRWVIEDLALIYAIECSA